MRGYAHEFDFAEVSNKQQEHAILGLLSDDIRELERELASLADLGADVEGVEPEDDGPSYPSLYEYVQATVSFELDPWQIDLCNRLQEAFLSPEPCYVLISIHPQAGKTLIISQRFLAWALGVRNTLVIKLAMYNVSHAVRKGGAVVNTLMKSAMHRKFFPDPLSRLPKQTSNVEFSTLARKVINDGQPSFMSLGLITGFTGEGADLLVIDDPYPDAAAARSEAYNKSVQTFWLETALPRLKESSKVFVMFHRYNVDDFAGWLLMNEPDRWQVWRYAAVADHPYEMEETGHVYPSYPLDRPLGAKLSPRYSWNWYNERKKDIFVWQGQFQGRPDRNEGSFFDMAIIRQPDMMIDEWDLPKGLTFVRCWDFAATEGGGAFSAGVLMAGPDKYGVIYICHSKASQMGTVRRMNEVETTANEDGDGVEVGYPRDPGSAGIDTAYFTQALALPDKRQWTWNPREDKITAAEPLQRAWNSGMIKIVRNPLWNKVYLRTFRNFPLAKRKDEVDATGQGYKRLIRLHRRQENEHETTSQGLFG